MDWSSDWPAQLASSGLSKPERIERLTANTWRFVVGDQAYVAKVGPGVGDEAEGLHRLAAVVGAPPVPQVVHVEAGLLVATWVEQGPRSTWHEEQLGRALATLHAAPCDRWGGESAWIGLCPVDPACTPTWAAFYGSRITDLARRCGLDGAIEAVVSRLDELVPPSAPSLVHGDLWWGNVLWGADGRAWLIDPSVHGGHGEEDLAMLALFGTVPMALQGAYAEVNPLVDGWHERVELFQLYPLLVHAVLFGGHYRSQAESIARRYA